MCGIKIVGSGWGGNVWWSMEIKGGLEIKNKCGKLYKRMCQCKKKGGETEYKKVKIYDRRIIREVKEKEGTIRENEAVIL